MISQLEVDGMPIVPERIIPGRTPIYLFQKHLSRYQFISEAVKGKRVLDVGCGDGYGSCYLARYAHEVIGIDIAPEIVASAQKHYRYHNLSFQVTDCTDLSFPARYFDVNCAFESFEHIVEVEKLVKESHRVLAHHGVFFVSTPNVKSYVATGRNPWHVKEYSYQEFYDLLSFYFPRVEIYGQFCRRPLRRALYRLSSSLYFSSRIYRRLLFSLGAFYVRHIGDKKYQNKSNWIESSRVNLFEFTLNDAKSADSFMAVCRKA